MLLEVAKEEILCRVQIRPQWINHEFLYHIRRFKMNLSKKRSYQSNGQFTQKGKRLHQHINSAFVQYQRTNDPRP